MFCFSDDVWDDEEADFVALLVRSTTLNVCHGSRYISISQSKNNRLTTNTWNQLSLIPAECGLAKLQQFVEDPEEDLNLDDIDENQLLQAAAKQQRAIENTKIPATDVLALKSHGALKNDSVADGNIDFVEGQVRDVMLRVGSNRISNADSLSNGSAQEILFDDELDFDYSIARDTNQKATARVVELLSSLDPRMDDQVILDACTELEELFDQNATLRRDLMSQPSVVPNIMEVLEMKKFDVLHAVLRVVNIIVEGNKKFQENLALVGLMPVIIKLTKQHNPYRLRGESGIEFCMDKHEGRGFVKAVRMEVAKFVQQCCKTSSLTLQMFIACGRLPVLVDFLTLTKVSFDLDHDIDLLRIALDGIFSVFSIQTIPKNDICRLFVKAGMLKKFVVVFSDIGMAVSTKYTRRPERDGSVNEASRNAIVSKGRSTAEWTMSDFRKTCDIFVLFSQGDAVVKDHMCDGGVLIGLLEAIRLGAQIFSPIKEVKDDRQALPLINHSDEFVSAIMTLLKCVRNLSMEPTTLVKLDRAGAIPTLVRLLNEQEAKGPSISDVKQKEVENVVLQSMFYLCRINRNRQTRAAQAGVIPSLIRVVQNAVH